MRNDLLEPVRHASRSVLAIEQVLLGVKLQAVRSYLRPGVVIYTHYLDGMVAPTRKYVEDLGFKVGLFTERWIERVGDQGAATIERDRLSAPLLPDLRRRAIRRYGDLSTLNQ